MLGILQSIYHIPEHPCHTIGIIGVILVNNGVCQTYSTCVGRVNVFYFKLPADQIGSKISAESSGILKPEYGFPLYRKSFLHPQRMQGIWMVCFQS